MSSSASSPTEVLRIATIVLAAGASSRMGQPKQLLPVAGQPLLLRAVDAALSSSTWPVIVVLGANAALIRPHLARRPVLIAENPAWSEGMASSLRSGIAMLQQFSRSIDGALIALCDQPAFSSETMAKLIAHQRATRRTIVAAHYNNRNGAPALFLREHFAALAALTGETGARDLLNGSAERVASLALPELALDLDTPEDYAAARAPR